MMSIEDFERIPAGIQLLYSVLRQCHEDKNRADDIIDSFSQNQFNAKQKVIEQCEMLGKDLEIVIFGSWYGSILIPGLTEIASRITCFDIDERALQISKNLFNDPKVDYLCEDVFDRRLGRYRDTDVVINTSCEHMRPMKEWPYWEKGMHIIMTSNNMYDIEGHINCVDTMEDFIKQLPESRIYYQDVVSDERGDRFIVAGQI